jgi:hypothetical protein
MQSRSKLNLWFVVMLLSLIAGCTGTSQPFTDDFSDPASGWGASSHETYVRGYQQGRYLFQIDVPRLLVWAMSGRTYSDVALEAIAKAAGQPDNHFGLICRYENEQFYYFAISSDGYYGILLMDAEGALRPLTGSAMLRSAAIRTDGTDNRIAAACEGSTLTLYVNGEQVARVQDETLTQGDVGMAAGALSQGGASIWFDDFEASKP